MKHVQAILVGVVPVLVLSVLVLLLATVLMYASLGIILLVAAGIGVAYVVGRYILQDTGDWYDAD